MNPRVLAVLYAALAFGCIIALYDTGARYHEFQIEQSGVHSVPESELAFYAWYVLWGSCATVLATLAALQLNWIEPVLLALEKLVQRPTRIVAVVAVLVPLSALGFRSSVLLDQPITDDESAYVFEALTLTSHRIVNPTPADPTYFTNQFIMVNEHGWFGQYPIGHPLLLALGELLHLRGLVVPLLAAGAVWLTFLVGCVWIGERRAALAACLLAVSPEFVWTYATLLSQTSALCCMLSGVWALQRLQSSTKLRWAGLAGASWGFMLLIRPMPGALMLGGAALCHVAWSATSAAPRPWSKLALHLLGAAPGVALSAALIGWTNLLESGNPFVSAYKVMRGGYGELSFVDGNVANAFGGALLRQNVWLLGWTLSLAFVPACRPRRGAALFWSLIVADYAYRLLVPKTVVATTGPIYVFEVVPLLVLATVDGAANLATWLRAHDFARAREVILAGALASSLIAFVTFVPIMSQAAHRGCAARSRVYELLEQAGAEHALIFANHLVLPDRLITWAYFPPAPSPALDDPYIFVRQPSGAGGPLAAHAFWRRRFPERRAFLYADSLRGQLFTELQAQTPPPADASLIDLVAQRAP